MYYFFIYIYKVKQNIMKDLNYILIVAFIFAFMGVNFLEQGNTEAGLFMAIPTIGTVLIGEIIHKVNDRN